MCSALCAVFKDGITQPNDPNVTKKCFMDNYISNGTSERIASHNNTTPLCIMTHKVH